MQKTPVFFWLMMVSIAMAVLPVWRSPMISSRWPRPIGVIASIALIPVWSGSCTDLRATMPGAFNSTRRVSRPSTAGLPSTGTPSAFTTRPTISIPTGTSRMRPVRRTLSPSRTCWVSPITAIPTLSSSRLSTRPEMLPGSSTSSPAITFSSPKTRAMPSPTESTVPVSATSISRPYSLISRFRMSVISAGLMSIDRSSLLELLGETDVELRQLGSQAAVEDHAADAGDRAAQQRGIDALLQLDLFAGPLRQRAAQPLALVVAQPDRRDDPGPHPARGLVGEPAELLVDGVEVDQPAAVDQIGQEVGDGAAGAHPRGEIAQHRAALRDRMQRPEDRVLQVGALAEQAPQLGQLAADLLCTSLFSGQREEGARVAAGRGAGVDRH